MPNAALSQRLSTFADELLSDREVAILTGRARPTLQKDRIRGTGIPFCKVGRSIRYRRSDVEAFIAELRRFRSTSEYENERQNG
jgi:predicted DNA-binding transcriptional regulator AlpA